MAWSLAELLAAEGRTKEAIAVLERHTPANSAILAWHLIDLGRVEDAVALLQQHDVTPVEPLWAGAPGDEPPF
ncbi:hypothetical protein OH738_39015 [Streptomyces hirsutus]|uniref:Tetratricopeptide repeat protein n=1 Tax=Streptomyces hirsutus TaxID=35620 RepID=A0ABZ1GE98_9ACTN|nr:hypothetical protein [Streptomyces hirsutus]WSD04467.1 hypothetical protein OIE73_00925 [Streptomyces hirsutus]WTD22142.1 hypothetical protein OH738_39015 [Streptomyces hirsutus]